MEPHLLPEISTEPALGTSDPDDLIFLSSSFAELEALIESDPSILPQIQAIERDRLSYFQTYIGVIRDEEGDIDQSSQHTERNRGPPRPLIVANENPFKGPGYEERINATMDPNYVVITMKQFRQRFASGSCLSAEQRKKIVNIERLRIITSKAKAERKKMEADTAAATKATGQGSSTGGEPLAESSSGAGVDAAEGPSAASTSTNGDGSGENNSGSKSKTSTPKPKSGPRLEDPMYPVINTSFNSVLSMTRTKARFKITARHPESGAFDSKPDMALYPGDDDSGAKKAYGLPEKDLKKNPDAARCAWAYILSPVEVKMDDTEAGFWFESSPDQARATKKSKKMTDAKAGTTQPKAKGKQRAAQTTAVNTQNAKKIAGARQQTKPRGGSKAAAPQEAKHTDADNLDPAAPTAQDAEKDQPAPAEEHKIIPRSADEFLRKTDKGNAARAQHAKYAAQIMLRQHRLHVISFYISGEWVRAYRWDQAGCVMTDPVNLVDNPNDFYDLLYCLGNLGDKWWGFDDTMTRATEDEIELLRKCSPDNEDLMRARDDMLNNKIFHPIYKVICPTIHLPKPKGDPAGRRDERSDDDEDSEAEEEEPGGNTPPEERAFLIGKLTAGHGTPIGRCTRGYIAFDLWSRDFCFLKDQWRSNVRRSELDVYTRLHENGVRCIATPIAGGDVRGMLRSPQHTQSQRYLADKSKQSAFVRIHTRVVVKEVGKPLEAYADSVQLLEVCCNAVIAHRDAWRKAGVLHRDISPHNILINVRNNEGLLNDWDLCKYKEDFGKRVREKVGISGTWPYLSSLTLQYPRKPPEVADDLESFIWVILMMAYRFHKHSLSLPLGNIEATRNNLVRLNFRNKRLADQINTVFYEQQPCEDGRYIGGENKLNFINTGVPPIRLKNKNSVLARFLRKAFELLHKHYSAVDFQALKPYYVEPLENNDKLRPFDLGKRKVVAPEDKFDLSDLESDDDDDKTPPPVKPERALASKRVFDDHKSLLRLLNAMIREKAAEGDDASADDLDDYVFDQFLGLPEVTYTRVFDTGQQKSTSSSVTSQKRPAPSS